MRKEIVLKGPSAVGSTVSNVDNSTWFSTTPILSEILVLRPWILQLDKSLTKVLWICKIIQQKLFSILNFDKTSILSELSYKVLSDKSLPFSVIINEKLNCQQWLTCYFHTVIDWSATIYLGVDWQR